MKELILEIPSHGSARLSRLEAGNGVRSEHANGQAEAVVAEREVGGVHLGADRAGHPAGAADRFGVDRSTVVTICRTAKRAALDAFAAAVPGRPGTRPEQAALASAQAEIERLRATVTEQAISLCLHEGKARWD
jgi:hypothetical protein